MVRLAATLVNWTRMAGRATLVPMEEASREATTRAEAIVIDVDVMEGRGVDEKKTKNGLEGRR